MGDEELGSNESLDGAGPMARAYESVGKDKKIAVMLVDFADQPGGVVSISEAQSRQPEVSNHLKNASYEKFEFGTMTVIPQVVRMPQPLSYYTSIAGGTGYRQLASDAKQWLVDQQGWDPHTTSLPLPSKM